MLITLALSTPVGSPCFRVPWLPGSVVVERFTLLTVLSHSIVDAPTHGVDHARLLGNSLQWVTFPGMPIAEAPPTQNKAVQSIVLVLT
jgi:hypothetical protein